MASDGYIAMASTELMNAIVDNHEAPMVLSSIMKQNVTNRGRDIINHAMDVRGRGHLDGRVQLLGQCLLSFPIATARARTS